MTDLTTELGAARQERKELRDRVEELDAMVQRLAENTSEDAAAHHAPGT